MGQGYHAKGCRLHGEWFGREGNSEHCSTRGESQGSKYMSLWLVIALSCFVGCGSFFQQQAHRVKSSVSRSVMSDSWRPHGLEPARLLCPWNSPGKDNRVGCHSLLQGIFPTQGSNPSLLHCRRILHQLSHKGNSRILEWVAYPFSKGLPDPGIKPGFPALQADSIPTELSGKPSFP